MIFWKIPQHVHDDDEEKVPKTNGIFLLLLDKLFEKADTPTQTISIITTSTKSIDNTSAMSNSSVTRIFDSSPHSSTENRFLFNFVLFCHIALLKISRLSLYLLLAGRNYETGFYLKNFYEYNAF